MPNLSPLRHAAALALALALAPTAARADDVILVPHIWAPDSMDPAYVRLLEQDLKTVLEDNDFLVLDTDAVSRGAGIDLAACDFARMPVCTTEALQSLPVRVAVLLTLQETPDATLLYVDFYDKRGEPFMQAELPVEIGKERKLALSVALFAVDAIVAVGPSPDAVVTAATRLVQGDARPASAPVEQGDIVVYSPTFDDDEPAPVTPDEDEDDVDDGPLTLDGGAPEDDVDGGVDEDDDDPVERIRDLGTLPPRLVLGAGRAFAARDEDADRWYQRRSPHAGRVILELRGGFSHSDGRRAAFSFAYLEEPTDTTPETLLWLEGPIRGLSGRAAGYVGYAPTTWIDAGLMVGVHASQDTIAIGYLHPDEDPDLGPANKFPVYRLFFQPRARFWPVGVGPAKPYVAVGAEATIVRNWTFTAEGAEAFARPPGGVMASFMGAAGLTLDPHPRVGLVLEVQALYHLGTLSNPRVGLGGDMVGNYPPAPKGSGFGIAPEVGFQLRL
jgi:hypothetical protein